jgi:hypothetical protein
MTSNFDHSPLNINLLIPFKDNIGNRQKLYLLEIDRFRQTLEADIESIKSELEDLFGKDFELSIVGRSDGNSKRYYWRFKSSKKDRKFNRLNSESLYEYLNLFSETQKIQLKEIERSIIYINANLKLVKGMIDSLAQCNDEIQSVHQIKF